MGHATGSIFSLAHKSAGVGWGSSAPHVITLLGIVQNPGCVHGNVEVQEGKPKHMGISEAFAVIMSTNIHWPKQVIWPIPTAVGLKIYSISSERNRKVIWQKARTQGWVEELGTTIQFSKTNTNSLLTNNTVTFLFSDLVGFERRTLGKRNRRKGEKWELEKCSILDVS